MYRFGGHEKALYYAGNAGGSHNYPTGDRNIDEMRA